MIPVFPHSEMVTMTQTGCRHFSVFEKGEAKELLVSREENLRTGEAECVMLYSVETQRTMVFPSSTRPQSERATSSTEPFPSVTATIVSTKSMNVLEIWQHKDPQNLGEFGLCSLCLETVWT